LVLLFLFTGSVLIPLKAVVLNVLSLLATLGVLVWIFQEGNLQWLVGDFTVTGSVDTSMAVLIAVVAFALSMDYEVFLISRIAEEHRRGSDTPTSVGAWAAAVGPHHHRSRDAASRGVRQLRQQPGSPASSSSGSASPSPSCSTRRSCAVCWCRR
jgi:uncharacterized membrane protein YdfJ with MMPL/SSD domain